MKRVQFGRHGLEVSEYCLGCLTMGRLQSNLSPEDGAEIIFTAVRNGVNFIDTAANYGNIEQIQSAIARLKVESPTQLEELVIATKTKTDSTEGMDDYVTTTLDQFKREHLDILCFHNIADEAAFKAREGAYHKALELRDEGLITELGWTAHSLKGLQPVLDNAKDVSIVMPIINFKGVGLRGFTLDELLEFLKEAKKKGLYVYSMKSLGGGHLRQEVTKAILWLRENPCVDVACVGAKSPAEVLMNVQIFNDEPVSNEIIQKIDHVPRRIIIYHHLCQKCGNCAEACTNGAMSFSMEAGPQINHELCVICGYCADACPKFIIRVV